MSGRTCTLVDATRFVTPGMAPTCGLASRHNKWKARHTLSERRGRLLNRPNDTALPHIRDAHHGKVTANGCEPTLPDGQQRRDNRVHVRSRLHRRQQHLLVSLLEILQLAQLLLLGNEITTMQQNEARLVHERLLNLTIYGGERNLG